MGPQSLKFKEVAAPEKNVWFRHRVGREKNPELALHENYYWAHKLCSFLKTHRL